ERVDGAAEKAGWWGLLVLRFIPVVAFTALNWGAGLCGVPRGRFLWTTAVGIAPGAVLFTSSGVGLGALWRRSPPLAGGLVALVLLLSALWLLKRRNAATA
ncbi:MAG: VTT domain-containing protein, partial [Gemmatimonadota bacterium]